MYSTLNKYTKHFIKVKSSQAAFNFSVSSAHCYKIIETRGSDENIIHYENSRKHTKSDNVNLIDIDDRLIKLFFILREFNIRQLIIMLPFPSILTP